MNKIENAQLSDRAVNQISDVIIPMIKERDKEIERLNKRIEDLNIINEEHQMLNGKLREELEFEKATNKELLSTGADLENKLYEEQDKNKRLNNIIKEVREKIEGVRIYGLRSGKTLIATLLNDILEILDKEN